MSVSIILIFDTYMDLGLCTTNNKLAKTLVKDTQSIKEIMNMNVKIKINCYEAKNAVARVKDSAQGNCSHSFVYS